MKTHEEKKKQISLHIHISECKLCGGTFKQMYKLRVHMEKRKNRFPFTSKCLNVNNVVKPLQVHVAKCMSLFIKLFKCKLCGEIFTEVNMTKTSSYVVKIFQMSINYEST